MYYPRLGLLREQQLRGKKCQDVSQKNSEFCLAVAKKFPEILEGGQKCKLGSNHEAHLLAG